MTDLTKFTDDEIGQIYKATIGYDPIEEGEMNRAETQEVLQQYERECEPLNIPVHHVN